MSIEGKPLKIKSEFGDTNSFIKDKPILVIDDEVDSGSVDTGEQPIDGKGEFDADYDPKTINSLIRKILNIFRKKFILAIQQHHLQIFLFIMKKLQKRLRSISKDYIIDLPIPSNHIGLEESF